MTEDKHKTKDELLREIAELKIQLAKLNEESVAEANLSHLEELELLRQASLSLTASLDIDVILRLITEYALMLVNAMTAHIFTYDGENLHFGGATWEGKKQDEPFSPPRKEGFTYYVAHQAQPVLVQDMSTHPIYEGTGWEGSILGLPLKVDRKVRGVMTVSLPQPHGFADEEVRILELLADQAAIALQNAQYVQQIQQAQEAEQKRITELELLRQASLRLTSSLDIQHIFDTVLDDVFELVSAISTHIFTYSDDTLYFGAALWDGKHQSKPFSEPRQNGLTYEVARSGEIKIVNNIAENPYYAQTKWHGNVLGIPLKANKKVVGVLMVVVPIAQSYESSELRILELLVDQATIAIQNAQYVNQIEQEIYERTIIQNALEQSEVRYRSLFENSPISLREEDWSAVKQEIEALQKSGISNLKKYLDAHPTILQTWAQQVRILDINQTTLHIYGANAKSELNAGTLSYSLHEQSAKFFEQGLLKLAQNQNYYQTEVLQYTLQDDPIYLLLGLAVAPEDTAQWSRILISAVDITQRKEAEARALTLEKERTRADTLYKLIQAITHDLRTPLTSINTSTYLLKATTDEERRQHHLNIIEGQTIHLSNLIDSILDVARLDTLQALSYSLINLSSVLHTLYERFHELADDKNLKLDFITEDDNIMLWASERELGNALGEIIKNAIQFTPAQGLISVKTHRTADYVMVTIEDNGVGMSEEILARAFDPFYRADEARSTKTGGTGLGLALAKKIIELHNGQIDVQSSEKVGTTCQISLPLNLPQ